MLKSLYVKDFAIVGEAEVAFGPGLTVVTGETGAGKSLLVDALLLLAGGRGEAVMVREMGADAGGEIGAEDREHRHVVQLVRLPEVERVRAIRVHQTGSPEMMQLDDVPVPAPRSRRLA